MLEFKKISLFLCIFYIFWIWNMNMNFFFTRKQRHLYIVDKKEFRWICTTCIENPFLILCRLQSSVFTYWNTKEKKNKNSSLGMTFTTNIWLIISFHCISEKNYEFSNREYLENFTHFFWAPFLSLNIYLSTISTCL